MRPGGVNMPGRLLKSVNRLCRIPRAATDVVVSLIRSRSTSPLRLREGASGHKVLSGLSLVSSDLITLKSPWSFLTFTPKS